MWLHYSISALTQSRRTAVDALSSREVCERRHDEEGCIDGNWHSGSLLSVGLSLCSSDFISCFPPLHTIPPVNAMQMFNLHFSINSQKDTTITAEENVVKKMEKIWY